MIRGWISNMLNSLGPTTKKKYILFESDDWGTFRMPSMQTYDNLKSKKIQLDFPGSDHFNLYDTLESREDLQLLFEVLESCKDSMGNSCVFTPLALCANPDFEKIRNSNYNEYHYLNLSDSFKKYQKGDVMELYFQGINSGIFLPQFHGREHLNIPVWMRALRNNTGDARLAFDHEVWGHINKHPNNIFYQAAFDVEFPEDITAHHDIIRDGLQLFKSTFGYNATYFVPPNGPMNNELLKTLAELGICLVTSDTIQTEVLGNGKIKRHFRYMGMKNNFGQRFIKRNCFFEPSAEGKDWIDSCMRDIEIAFKYNKPAVISTHRVNYVGGLNISNRDNGIIKLKYLLNKIVSKWSDVEFIDTSKLNNILNLN